MTETAPTSSQIQEPQLPAPVARRGISEAVWRTLRNSVYPGASSESVVAVIDYCRARGLDPLKRPCHIVPMQVKDARTGASQWRDVIMRSIDELRITASRTGVYAGQDEPAFGSIIEYLGLRVPEWCRVTVYRLVDDQRVPFYATEYFVEACATSRDRETGEVRLTPIWQRRPRAQLAKCAEAQALRRAFPEELGGERAIEQAHAADDDGSPQSAQSIEVEDPIAYLSGAHTVDDLQARWHVIKRQAAGAEIPVALEAKYFDRREALEQAASRTGAGPG
jgi:phage recombination protein Bet